MNRKCVIVFPLYKAPDTVELAFLEHGLALLKDFPAVIAGPESLVTDSRFGSLQDLQVYRFPDNYFAGIQGYNQLMLSADFYSSFDEYEYMLIHQADVYVFRNELAKWCEKGYSYIGSPWYRPQDTKIKSVFNTLRSAISRYGMKHNKVGNGGFSLRHVKDALKVLSAAPDILNTYRFDSHHSYNEDVFWSVEAPKIVRNFTIPGIDEALHFGMEFNPESAFARTGRLPFGCHAPQVHGREFWKKYIPELQGS